MNKPLFAALAALLLLGPARSVLAQDGQTPPPAQDQSAPKAPAARARRGRGSPLERRLGLSDDEAAKLRSAMQAHRQAMLPLRQKGRELMRTLARQVRSKAADADIQKTLDAMEQNRKDVQTATDKFQADVAFLTPTQRAKLVLGAMRMKMRHGWGMRPGAGQGGGMGPRSAPNGAPAPAQGGSAPEAPKGQ